MSTKRAGATCLRMHAHYTRGPGFPRIMPPGSGVLAQAVQSYSILAPVNINASSYPAPYSKNKGPQRRRPVLPNFQMLAPRRQKCVQNHCGNRPNWATTPTQSDPQTQKRAFAGGRKSENGECHVHASSSRGAGCWSSSGFVRHRRVDRPWGIHADKVVLGRKPRAIFECPYNSRNGFCKILGV